MLIVFHKNAELNPAVGLQKYIKLMAINRKMQIFAAKAYTIKHNK